SRPPDFSVLATNLPEVFSYPDKVIEQRHYVSFFRKRPFVTAKRPRFLENNGIALAPCSAAFSFLSANSAG
ncbi:MAG: hypothetical protein ACXWNN_04820, partial [Candidatus Binataceae bacterium]